MTLYFCEKCCIPRATNRSSLDLMQLSLLKISRHVSHIHMASPWHRFLFAFCNQSQTSPTDIILFNSSNCHLLRLRGIDGNRIYWKSKDVISEIVRNLIIPSCRNDCSSLTKASVHGKANENVTSSMSHPLSIIDVNNACICKHDIVCTGQCNGWSSKNSSFQP